MSKNNGGWIRTYTDRRVYPLAAEAETIHIRDIAHALSMLCRYTGHSAKFYSVAEHCVMVSRALEKAGFSRRIQKIGLLHDSSEAYMNDIASPVKRGLPEYKTYENQLQAVIAKRFDLPYPFPEVIHDFDHRILPDEIKVLFSSKDMWDSNYEPLGMKIKCWLPRKAEKEYINRWEEVRRA